jgi:hypothetical protein
MGIVKKKKKTVIVAIIKRKRDVITMAHSLIKGLTHFKTYHINVGIA